MNEIEHKKTISRRKFISASTLAAFSFFYIPARLLGMVAIRMKVQPLERDAENLKFRNNNEANELLHIKYRDGWTL
ncbi:hypothetical protein JXQ31_01205 [candidate division KSB1 bacterium]|nr:hypothetical protein [candidate division KSB1 bacterium]